MANGRSRTPMAAIIIGVILLLLFIGWFSGLFGAGEEAVEVEGDEAVVTEDSGATEGAATEEAVEEAAEDAAD